MGFGFQDRSRTALDVLIAEAQEAADDDTAAMEEIIRRFELLALRLARSIAPRSAHLHDDLANVARLAVVRAVRRHDGRPDTFPGFAERYMRGAVIREYQRWLPPEIKAQPNRITPASVYLVPTAEEFEDGVVDALTPWGDGEVASIVPQLKPIHQVLVELRYVQGASLKEIAADNGTSESAVSQRLATIHRTVASALVA